MTHAKCCEQGSKHIWFKVFGVGHCDWAMESGGMRYPNLHEADRHYRVSFCPFCGTSLNAPQTLEQALRLLSESDEKLTICFDVDGVLCDDRDTTIPYMERPPYHWVADVLGILSANGHTIHIQTARYMAKCDGDQTKAGREGYLELQDWLKHHGIPHHRAYLGKASADLYADDRGCHIVSNRGTIDWSQNLFMRIAEVQRSKRANLRV